MRRTRVTSALAIGAATAIALATVPAVAAPGPTWTLQLSANPSLKMSLFTAVSASSGSAWAVGRDLIGGRSHPLLEHLTGSRWVKYSVKLRTGDNELDGVVTLSKTDAWAVGSHINDDGGGVLVQHFNGKAWSNVSAPHTTIHKQLLGVAGPAYGLQAVTALSRKNIWAVGSGSCEAIQCPDHPVTEHYNGKHWSAVKVPNPGGNSTLTSVSALNSTHVWAAGFNAGNGQAIMLGFNGKHWHQLSIPEPGETTELFGLTAKSSKATWAVGSYSVDSLPSRTLTLHRVGGVWRKVSSPNPAHGATLRAVTALSRTNVWAVGESVDPSEIEHPLIEHYNGKAWSIVKVANPTAFSNSLAGVSVRASKEAFAVGSSFSTGTLAHTLALKTKG